MASIPARTAITRPDKTTGGERELVQERAVLTRERIVAAAAEAFAEHGFAEITIVRIAEITGMTKGAVYFHFKNKEALAAAVADSFGHRIAAIAEAAAALQLTPLETLTAFLSRVALAFRDEVLVQAGAQLQAGPASPGVWLSAPDAAFGAFIEARLEEAGAGGQLPEGTCVAALSRVLVEAVFGAWHISWVQSGRADVLQRTRELIAVLVPRPPASQRDRSLVA